MLFRTSASVIALVACTSLAAAADLNGPSYGGSLKDDYAAPSAFSWTGLYIGGNLGYAWGDADIDRNPIDSTLWTMDGEELGNGSADVNGWFGGGHVGYLGQSGMFVLGIEADLQFGDMSGSSAYGIELDNDWGTVEGKTSVDVNYFGSVRARLGLANNGFMPYITGGFAWADVDIDNHLIVSNPVFGTTVNESQGTSKTFTGWVAGGGVELSLSENWRVRGEYLYYDLGSEDYSFTYESNQNYTHTISGDVDLTFHTFRIGASYKFGN